ncbi:hypothetical protein PIB30_024323 [Stylosanthes scabra]|uniref:Uncharacterized protein n=1 Tax=Stylosanthes scabra TaxID=79078 RepID=A0ABU6Y8P7_9FABA|nr:hypothetical protein [Stylosanthes scabra]
MASSSGRSIIASFLVAVITLSSMSMSLAARHLLQTSAIPNLPPGINIPNLPKPTATMPPLPSIPTLPSTQANLPPLPTIPSLPQPSSSLPKRATTFPPLPAGIPTIPTTVPQMNLPPLPNMPSIPTTIPSIPFFSPPPSPSAN